MRVICSLILTLLIFLPSDAMAKRVTLPSMFFDIPDSWSISPLHKEKKTNWGNGVTIKPTVDASYSIIFAFIPQKDLKESYRASLDKTDKKYIIEGNMTFAGHTVPSFFWSETPNTARYLLEIPSKKGNNVYVMYIHMSHGTQEQWDTWSAEAEKMLRSLHRLR